jgi:hypothetical protein
MKILFIVKNPETNLKMSSGLLNSAQFNYDMVKDILDIEIKLVSVADNNDIDKEVNIYKPTHVIIEALWVVPEKFDVLYKLHPEVQWIIRLHSNTPFIANEGIAMDWILYYLQAKNVSVATNSLKIYKELLSLARIKSKLIYLPNYYPKVNLENTKESIDNDYINIACFGAIRPFKNHLIQAMAAINFAEKIGKKLKFHINGTRLEMNGSPILHNLVGLFSHMFDKGHLLVNHSWLEHKDFLELCSTMDIGMQVSFSETFNIVAADLISVNVPVIGSKEIPWLGAKYVADPTDMESILDKLLIVHKYEKDNVRFNKISLNKYSINTIQAWNKFIERETDGA